MTITIPELSLVVLIGPSGCGKSSFAREHFKSTEVLSSDFCRGLVSDDENSQEATNDAFDVLHYVARKRLAAGRLTVVDATNVQPEARKPLVALAREFHVLPVAIVLNLPEKVCHERNQSRRPESTGVEPVSLLREPLFSRQVPYRPAHSPSKLSKNKGILVGPVGFEPTKGCS